MKSRIIYFFLFLCFLGVRFSTIAQKKEFQQFVSEVKSANKDSLLLMFENKIQLLKKNKTSNIEIVKYARLQKEIGDSLNRRDLKNSAAMELIKFPEIVKKRDLFFYLLTAGNFQNKNGDHDVGSEIHYKAMRLAEELKNDTLKAKIFYQMGNNFKKANNIPLSKKYLNLAIKINIKLNDTINLAGSYMSLGNSYKNSEVYDSALIYYNESLNLANLIQSERTIAGNYNNIGNVYRIQKKYNTSIEHYLKAVEINKRVGNMRWLSYNYNNLGVTYKTIKKYNKALNYYQESLEIKEDLGDFESMISTKENISELYFLKRNYKLAYENLSEAEELRNEFANEEKLNLTTVLESKFQNEQKENLLKQLEAEQELQDVILAAQEKKFELQSEVKKEREKLMIILVGVIVSLVFGVILFWRNAIQKKKYVHTLHQKNNQIRTVNNDLQKAQDVLTEKNNEITDSITYAKRIQAAILPSQNLLKATLENAFVLYLPKDIVAGDFYWTEQVGDTVLFAVADCTGHGVPGAMVSVICNNALNASIKNDKLTDPGKILDNTTDIVLRQFSKSEEDVKDGMDIGLCAFDRKKKVLKFAGANIPLWLIRNGEVIEFKASRQPVGNYVVRDPFMTNEIEIQNNDIIYLSSDGFADQFGGNRNKKYMKKKFKKLLADIGNESIAAQNELISTVFVDWKATNEQVDDICVMGIRFNL